MRINSRNVVETAIEMSKIDKTSSWWSIRNKFKGKTWAELSAEERKKEDVGNQGN